MQYTVVHSADPYLLARLATDLQMGGIKPTKFLTQNKWIHPWDTPSVEWLECGYNGYKDFNLHNHPCLGSYDDNGNINSISITESNYIKVLTQILQP